MQRPDVVVVPATPSRSSLAYNRGSTDSSPTSISSVTQHSFDLSRPSTSSDNTTLSSLYTMYSEDPSPKGNGTARVLEVNLNGHVTLNPPIRNSSLRLKNHPKRMPSSEELASQPGLPVTPRLRTPSPELGGPSRPPSAAASRPLSVASRPPSSVYFEVPSRPTSTSTHHRSRPPSVVQASPSPSRPVSTIHQPSPHLHATLSPSSSRPVSTIHRTSPSPSRSPSLSRPPPIHVSHSSSPSPTADRSASTLTSLPPTPRAPNEEIDAHHVRSTYAMLESTGVADDGFTDGVERTRSRSAQNLSSVRASELMREDAALGSADERRRDLEDREVRTLGKLDRYGFFNTDDKDEIGERMVWLPAEPFQTPLTKGKGKGRAAGGPKPASKLPHSLPIPKEDERMEKWTRMLEPSTRDFGGNAGGWRVKPGKEAKLRRRIYKGVPDRWRGAVWEMLLHARSAEEQNREKEYYERLEEPSSYDVQIDLDVPRTIGNHIMFRTRYGAGQRSLFHVLHSFSLHCDTCGYVQGMGPITSTLLLYLPPSHVYDLLTRLHSPAYNLHSTFAPGFPGLMENVFLLESLIRVYMPPVYENLKTIGVNSLGWVTRGFITMFMNGMGFQSVLRIWDVWILEGEDLWPVLGCAIVWAFRDWLGDGKKDFENILGLLSSFFVVEDEDALVGWVGGVLGDKGVRAQLKTWRTEWKGLVEEGKEGGVLL